MPLLALRPDRARLSTLGALRLFRRHNFFAAARRPRSGVYVRRWLWRLHLARLVFGERGDPPPASERRLANPLR